MRLTDHPAAIGESTTDWAFPPPVPAAPALRGDVQPALAGYRLLRCVGQGRRSVVWLVQDEAGRELALKLPAPGVPAQAAEAAFAREFALAAGIAHPHLVRVLEQGRAGGVPYLALEYLAGGDLATRLQQPQPLRQVRAWLRQAAAALAALHGRGLVHRDVKPANFLLRPDGNLVLADFGLVAAAGAADPQARPGAIVGTPRYVAPEHLQGAPAQPAADVYGLGVLLHEMLCGGPPFTGKTLMEVLSQHLVAAPPPLPAAAAGLQPLADAMLAKDARARLPDAAAVLAHIDSLEPEGPAAAVPAGERW